MTFLWAMAVFVGALAALNLILTLGVIRRLREHSERLNNIAAGPGAVLDEAILDPGERPADISATTVDGTEVSTTGPGAPTLVGFFMVDCSPCEEWIPRFTRAAEALPGGRSDALAVVVGLRDEDTGEYVGRLRDAAQVVTERPNGPVATAFSVTGFPAMCRLGTDGTVVSNAKDRVVTEPVGV